MGVLDQTLTIFTSDHGFNTGHHGLWGFLLQLNSTYTCLRAVEEYERLHHFRYDFAGRRQVLSAPSFV